MLRRRNHPPGFCYIDNKTLLKLIVDIVVKERCRKALAGEPREMLDLRLVCRYFWRHRKIDEVMWVLRYGGRSSRLVTFPSTVKHVLDKFQMGEILKCKIAVPHPKVGRGVVFITLVLEDPDRILIALQELLAVFVANECDRGDFDRVHPRFRTQLSTWTEAIKRIPTGSWRKVLGTFLTLYYAYPVRENIWCADGCLHWVFKRHNDLHLPSCFTSRTISGLLPKVTAAHSFPRLPRTDLGASDDAVESTDEDVVSI